MAFLTAMKKGINGADVYTEEGVGDYRVSLFTMLNRGLEASYIQEYVSKIFQRKVYSEMEDMFVMAFQTRDIRGGKGERRLFYSFLKALYKEDPIRTALMIPLVPTYGCWRDMWEILKEIPELEHAILDFTKQTFEKDLALASGSGSGLSLLAKWLPREHSKKYPGLAHKLATHFYASNNWSCIVQYRKHVSMLNKALHTIEINMCGGTWREIKPEAVPGRSLKIHKKAFLNLACKKETLRFPENEDRMTCRQHFLDFIESMKKGEAHAHGANVVMPHEIVVQALLRGTTVSELDILQGQWNSIREETLRLGGLGKCVPMCDFSGSMSGIPKLVSLALGILISEINHSAFRDHILTFDAEPVWHSFTDMVTLKQKLNSIGMIGQGLNTNFYKACMRIVDTMKQHRVPVGEEPEDLIVLTDMGFDAASRDSYRNKDVEWKSQLSMIRDVFKKAGESVWGEGNGWKPPRIVIWNLRAEYKDFHAKADQDGVVQLSGWSPSILKALQKGGVQVMTPYQGLRVLLDDERYDPVRRVWNESNSGAE